MTTITAFATALDTLLALALVGVAVAFIARRTVRTFSARRGGGCHCPNESVCGPKGPASSDLSAAARRAVSRLEVGERAQGSSDATAPRAESGRRARG
jgi:hypothetical protein